VTPSVHSDPWVLPPIYHIESWGYEIPLSPTKLNYVEIAFVWASSPKPAPSSRALNLYVQSPWLGDGTSLDPLKEFFPSDEAIIETMSFEEPPWSNHHHRSSFLPTHREILTCLKQFSFCLPSQPLQKPIQIHQVSSEGDMVLAL